MAAEFPITYKSTGLNNIVDKHRLPVDYETGTSDLAVAVNVDIDDSGMISRRHGQIEIMSGDTQVWCRGGDGFAVVHGVSDSTLYRTVDGSVFSPLWTGFTKGARFSFEQAAGRTYFMNGFQAGYIEDGVVNPWPTSNHVGSVTTRAFYDAPIGTKIAYHKSRMWIVIDKVVWITEPDAFGKVHNLKGNYQFGTAVTMIKPVENGVWISDSEKTSFITTGDRWIDNRMDTRSLYPAHEWSENIELVDLSDTIYQIPGFCALWSCDAGQMIGTPDGQIKDGSEDKLIYQTGGSGCTVVGGHKLINSVY